MRKRQTRIDAKYAENRACVGCHEIRLVERYGSCFEKRRKLLVEKSDEYQCFEGSRPRGRQRKIWINVVQENMRLMGLVRVNASGRDKWRRLWSACKAFAWRTA